MHVLRGSPAAHAFDDGTRRTEVLEIAASLIATSGLRTSMHEIAGAAGIQTGSLYHHFESKEALLTELLRRYHADLDHIAEHALGTLDDPGIRPGFGRIADLGVAIARCAVAHRAAIRILAVRASSSNADSSNGHNAARGTWRRCTKRCGQHGGAVASGRMST